VVQNFYLDIRKSLLHPSCVVEKGNRKTVLPYDEYKLKPSAKLDALVEILQHHLATDGAPPKRPSRQMQEPVSVAQSFQQQQQQPPEPQAQTELPDKIIIYSYFPSAFDLIQMVSDRPIFESKR
jgi:hypothetical protein